MKLLVMSDTHNPSRSNLDLNSFISKFDFDYLIHCWDFDKMETYSAMFDIAWTKLKCVHWNSDEESLKRFLPEYTSIKYKNFNFWIIHSHKIYPRGDIDKLIDFALNNNLDVLFYWHTHIKKILKYCNWQITEDSELNDLWNGNIFLVNPWSLVNWDYLFLKV